MSRRTRSASANKWLQAASGRRRIRPAWQGRQIKVVSREGLTEMKRLAGRRIDLEDLENLGLLKEGDNAGKS